MEVENQKVRTGPGPTDPEIHARICQLKISITPHPSKMLQRGGNVFPLVADIDEEQIIKEIENEPVYPSAGRFGTRDSSM